MSAWAAVLLAAAAASAADPSPAVRPADPSTTVGGITVEGHSRKAVEAFHAAANHYVQGQTPPGPVKQITKWSEPICPATKGLTLAFNDFVTQRIEEVAVRVGAPRPHACVDQEPNVEVIFTAEPQKAIDDIRVHYPSKLGFNYSRNGEAKPLAAFAPPMTSWYGSVTLWRKPGDTVNIRDRRFNDSSIGHRPFCLDMESVLCHGALTKGMLDTAKSRFDHVLVVVDASRTEGKTIGAVADEIAMTVLSRRDPNEGCSALPSVMDALAACPDSATLEGLTPYDEAFLKALYAPQAAEFLPVARAQIEQAVRAVGPPP